MRVTPEANKSINGWLTLFWSANQPVVVALYFVLGNDTFQRFCLLYLAVVSIWANQASHFSGWIAGRIEVAQHEGESS